jgi:glycerophosphoryl diester phosphodiesterase
MKIFSAIILSIFLAACSAPTTTPNTSAILTVTAPQSKSTASVSPSASPSSATATHLLVVAHRGGAGLAPENTLASFRNGIALGADFIEMDVHLTKDGVPVIIHDPTLDRTSDGKGPVSDFTLAELQAFNAAAKFTGASDKQVVPTLAQVLDLAKPTTVKLEIEIKTDASGKRYPDIEQKVLNEITTRGMLDRVKIMAFEFDTLKQIRALNPKVTTVALMTTDYFRARLTTQPAAIAEEVAPFSDGIGIDKNFLSANLVQEAHARKLAVGVWTVDTEAEMQRFIAMGVDGITSNRPDVLKRVLGR